MIGSYQPLGNQSRIQDFILAGKHPALSLKIARGINSTQGSPANGLLGKNIIKSGRHFLSKMPDLTTTLHIKMKIENHLLTAYSTMTAAIKTPRNRIFIS